MIKKLVEISSPGFSFPGLPTWRMGEYSQEMLEGAPSTFAPVVPAMVEEVGHMHAIVASMVQLLETIVELDEEQHDWWLGLQGGFLFRAH